MKTIFQLVNLKCQITYQTSETFGSGWRWKLDPYKASEMNEADLTIELSCNQQEAIFQSEDSLLRVEPAGFFQHRVYRNADGSTSWRYVRNHSEKVYLSYRVDSKWEQITLQEDNTQTAGYLAFEYLGQMMPSVLLKHGALTFHGVLMEYQGQGIIISASSGTGKSTHARLWRDLKNALIINGDRATLQKENGAWTGFGLPWSGTSGEQVNRKVSLKALVVLERSEQNEAYVINGLEAFGAVLPHVQYADWDKELTEKAMTLLDDFLREVPVIRLRCRPDAESVEVLKQVLEEL